MREINFEYYFNNAKECLNKPHTIKDVHFNRTDRGDYYLTIVYSYNHIEGQNVDLWPQFVSIFYNTDFELKQIKTYLNI
jgi:hypothetical protein